MSTYAIADAINKLADNIKYAIGAKNQIEKDKLAFEKEKFEFYKQQFNTDTKPICEHEWRYRSQGSIGHHYICTKCGTMKVVPLENLSSTDKECDHNWKSFFVIDKGGFECRDEYRCSKCGAIKT